MAPPNVKGRLQLTGVHQKPPASLQFPIQITLNATLKPNNRIELSKKFLTRDTGSI